MGNLRAGHLIEAAFWLCFAALAFVYSFEFDRSIEVYRYGASAWPRAIIVLIALAALGQLYRHWRHGDEGADELAGAAAPEGGDDGTGERGTRYYLRTGGMFALPLLYAYFMNDLGFYASTPFFILGVLLLMGERRPLHLAAVTLAVYAAIVIVFGKLLYVGLPTGNVSPFYDFSNWLLVVLRGN